MSCDKCAKQRNLTRQHQERADRLSQEVNLLMDIWDAYSEQLESFCCSDLEPDDPIVLAQMAHQEWWKAANE